MPDFLFVIWEGEGVATSEDRRKEAMDLMGTYVMELLGKGKLKGGGPLYSPSEGKTAKGKNGKPVVVDGPYLETKDIIGGFFLVEAESMKEAAALAKDCPAALYGGVEVRGIIPMG